MKLNWICPSKSSNYNKNLASVWIRCLQLIPYLERKGIQSTVNQVENNADIALFIRSQDNTSLELAKKAKNKGQKVVFDLCVNYLDISGEAGKGFGSFSHQRDEALRMLELSDAVTCASNNIAESLRHHHGNVHYLSDSINMEHFRFKKDAKDFDKKKIELMYAGVACKTSYLFENIYPVARELKHNLHMVMDERSPFFKIYRYHKWKYEKFPSYITQSDIGLAPRDVDTSYDKGHSIFKIGVFLAQGVPVLASPVPSYYEVLGDGKAGLICHTPNEWKNALIQIKDDHEILKTWSYQAQEKMVPYSTFLISNKYHQLLQELIK